MKTGGSGAHTVAIVYEPELTLGLPREESVGTAMNALAHAAEALYAGPCEDAATGARLISTWLPVVAADGSRLDARTALLEGAMHAGMALAERGMFLAHAMAQALGGRYGVSHGAMNALCLAPALRFNEPVVPGGARGARRSARRGRSARPRRRARPARRLHAPPRSRRSGGRARRGCGGSRRASTRSLQPTSRVADRDRGAPPLDLVS